MSPCKRRCRASTSGTSLILEQDGTGDPVAQFLLTGEQAFTYGLDNDDGNKFKMAFSNNGFASGVVAEFTTALNTTLFGGLTLPSTITAPGTTGNQTINKPTGRVNIAAAGTTITVTNNLVTANSHVIAWVATSGDATAKTCIAVPGAGSFVVTLNAAATGEVPIGFLVIG
jgi:hypothetical protein